MRVTLRRSRFCRSRSEVCARFAGLDQTAKGEFMVRPHGCGRRETIGLLPGDRSFDRR